MKRRTVLKALAASAITPGALFANNPAAKFGWRYDPVGIDNFIRNNRYPFLSQINENIKGTGKGKKAFLHKALEKAMGKQFVPHNQGIGDCVGQAAALGVDILSAVEIVIKNQPERWVAKAATEPIYGGSRVEVGNYTSGEGSTGHWAAQWLSQYGVLLRQEYPGWDFSVYDPALASQFGTQGCPDELEPIAKLHPIKKAALCTTYEDLCDSIYNGYPVMVCSGVGFGRSNWTRDSEGFLTRKRDPWWHAMLFAGYDDSYRRPGALCFNSWGDWVVGPTRGPQPRGTFWIDAETVDAMLKQSDSFAFSDFAGFPSRIIPPYIFY